jgi:microcystin-dependent protein
MGQYHTGDKPANVTYTDWLVRLPNIDWVRQAFSGALFVLGANSTWVTEGNATGDETAQWFKQAFLGLREMDYRIGMVFPTIAEAIPDDTLICNGGTYNRDDYPLLWEVLPAGSKTPTTFTLPDLSDRFIRGANSPLNVGNTGGADSVTLTTDEMPSHTHLQQPHSHSYTQTTALPTAAGIEPTLADVTTQIPSITGVATAINEFSGGGLPHENLPPYYDLIYVAVAR